MGLVHGYGEQGEGGYVVRRPRVTDAVSGALLRSYAHTRALPDDMRLLVERLDRQPCPRT